MSSIMESFIFGESGGPSTISQKTTSPATNNDDIDAETSALIARLYLEDLEEVFQSRKGKARADAPLSDEQHAMEAQRRYLQQLVTLAEDERLSKSISTAVDIDQDYLDAFIVAEAAAVADRRAAEMLSRGESLPQPTEFQARLERPDFVMHPEQPSAHISSGKTKGSEESVVSSDEAPCHTITLEPSSLKTFKPSVPSKTLNDDLDTSSSDESDDWSTTATFHRERIRLNTPKNTVFVKGAVTGPRPNRSKLVECIICSEQYRSVNTFHVTSCDHYYCRDCIGELVEHFVRDESLFPLRCCQVPIPIIDVDPFISQSLRTTFRQKHAEFSVLSKDRVYCVVPTCSRFLGSGVGVTEIGLRCGDCGAETCPRCKQAAHGYGDCTVHASTMELKALADREGWQTCPGCETLVELDLGCYHMTCRCRTQFCYLCAALWKNCECPQWEEARLLATAQQRVENELGARAVRNLIPEIFAQHVQERAQTLRFNHNCDRHNWRFRPGGGRCEECHFNLPQYLLVCQGCSILACVRCSRNRL